MVSIFEYPVDDEETLAFFESAIYHLGVFFSIDKKEANNLLCKYAKFYDKKMNNWTFEDAIHQEMPMKIAFHVYYFSKVNHDDYNHFYDWYEKQHFGKY